MAPGFMHANRLLAAICIGTSCLGAGGASAFETVGQNNVWERFGLTQAQSAGVNLRGFRPPQFAPDFTPVIGLNYENAHVASAVRGAWLEGGRVGPVAVGALVNVDRHLALSGRQGAADPESAMRYGAFLAYSAMGQEVGRFSVTTGRLGGVDLRATTSFKLNDNVSLEVGPLISLGSFERFGYRQAARAVAGAVSADKAQLSAFGLAAAIETQVSERTVARMFADYARVQGASGGPQVGARDRVDFGFSLTTRIGQ
jgi:hypothetical protein